MSLSKERKHFFSMASVTSIKKIHYLRDTFLYFLAHGGSIIELVLAFKNVELHMNRNSTTLLFCCDEKMKNASFGPSFSYIGMCMV